MPDRLPEDPCKHATIPFLAPFVLMLFTFGCTIYANLSLAVVNPVDYGYFPPFTAYYNGNYNHHLGAEYLNIGRALADGRGYADPFDGPTGPTAWQPPIYPFLLAAFLKCSGGDREAVMFAVILLQTLVLTASGILVIALTTKTCQRVGAKTAVVVLVIGEGSHFSLLYQWTHDLWLVMAGIDGLIAGLVWLKPLSRRWSSAVWGLFGGACALVNPAIGLVWGISTVILGIRSKERGRLALSLAFALLATMPWIGRNYLVFGRLIPLKSNLAYELYQSQCLQKDGLLRGPTFDRHPYHRSTSEREEYERLGETAFLDRKMGQFTKSVQADPMDFVGRIGQRLLGATLWYEPFWPREWKRPYWVWATRILFPLPFLCMLLLVAVNTPGPLAGIRWLVMAIYSLYLVPYVLVSYYERYEAPLLCVKALLTLWAIDWIVEGFRVKGKIRRV